MPSEKPPNQGAFDFGGPPKRAEPEPERQPDRGPPIPPAPVTPTLTRPEPKRDESKRDEPKRDEPKRDEPRVFTVSDLVRGVARTVEARFGMVWVEGEISNFSAPRSGHL